MLKIRLQENFIVPKRKLSLFPEFTYNTFLIYQFQTKGTRTEGKLTGHESLSI